MILYMYIAPGQTGADNLLGTKVYVNRNILSRRSFVTSFKKSLCSLILYNCFMSLNMYIAPGQSFDVNRIVSSLHSVVASFKTSL